ncbi:MAG: hypothetical protein ABFS34_12675 [Gemmatimonadota bacterium]
MRVPRSILIVSGVLALATCMEADPTALEWAGAPGLGLVPGPPGSFCGVATVVDLVADEDVVVGAVEIVNDEASLFVTFRADADAPLIKTAVAVVQDPTEIPTNRTGSPRLGRFPYKANHNGGPTSVTWQVDVPLNVGEVLHVAAFAEVVLNQEEEGAWGDGEQINPSSGWATRFTHAVQSCDGTIIRTVPTTGGTILAAGLELVIPDGSLDEPTTFSLAPTAFDDPDVPTVAGTAWEIEPSGTTFDPPALLTLAYVPENLPPGFPEGGLKCFVVSGVVLELIQPISIDQVNHLITCPLSHLSVVGVGAPGGGPIAESIAVTDAVTINVRSPIRPDVAEAVAVTDAVTINVRSPIRPDVAEAVAVADDVTINVRSPIRPDVTEEVAVTDDVTVNVVAPVRSNVAEAIGVTDHVTVTVVPTAPTVSGDLLFVESSDFFFEGRIDQGPVKSKVLPDGTPVVFGLVPRSRDPVWSPNRSTIALSGPTGPSVVNADGTSWTALDLPLMRLGRSPSWVNDNALAFHATETNEFDDFLDTEIYAYDLGSDLLTQLTDNAVEDRYPDVSGGLIAYVRGDNEIRTVNVDGTGDQSLFSTTGLVKHLDFSGDGSRLAFARQLSGADDELVVVDMATLTPTVIATGGFIAAPDWSPDDALIAFVTLGEGNNAETLVINYIAADGSGTAAVLHQDDQFFTFDMVDPDWR